MHPINGLAHLAANGTPPACRDTILRMSVGLEESLKRFEQETLPFIASGGGDLQFISGSYGKTHFLKALLDFARDRDFVTVYVDCQDERRPFESLDETYREIAIEMVPPRDVQPLASAGITNVIGAQFTGKTTDERNELAQRVKAGRGLVADYRNLVWAYCRSACSDGDEYLAENLEVLLTGGQTRVGELYRRHDGLPRPLGKLARRNAAVWLRGLLSLPRVLGYRGLIVCFDNTGAGHSAGSSMQSHLAHIRTFVDHLAAGAFRGCAVYWAVASGFMTIAEENYPALSDRIQRPGGRAPRRNSRAVSVVMDDLLWPNSTNPAFFVAVAERVVGIGVEAGLSAPTCEEMLRGFRDKAEDYAANINEGRVQEWVKRVAASVINQLR